MCDKRAGFYVIILKKTWGEKYPMNRLYRKNELMFSIIWIIIYVVGFSLADNFSNVIGIEKIITVILGIALSGILFFSFCPL